MKAVAAVDLGATSGRVILGYVSGSELRMKHVARFPNQPVRTIDGLHWNVLELYRSVTAGLTSALRDEPGVASIGIDSWAVDYGLLRGEHLVQTPFHYRDARTAAGVAAVHERIPADELYRRNGLQHLPFNTVFQLAADADAGILPLADRALLIPDLFAYWLTGAQATEITNASTTGLLDPHTRGWDADLFACVGLPPELFAPLIEPGASLAPLLPAVAADLGASHGLGLTAVGSHDTASAVVGVPAQDEHFAYISSGTWSLVGVELAKPVVSSEGLAANFTNEGGVDGRIRYLTNVSGLWLLSESIRAWEKQSGETIELAALLAQASSIRGPITVFDAADERFIAPGNMPGRIVEWCVEHGREQPRTRPEFVRAILESLAAAYAVTIEQAAALSGVRIDVIHMVGGGSQNALLCQLTADATGRPVLAGPVEATAIGNILVQARAAGIVSGSLEALRAIVRAAHPPVRFEPRARR